MCKFCEAILYYSMNLDMAPDKSIKLSDFSAQIYAAYSIFVNVWLAKTNDARIRQVIIESIGHFVHLMRRDQLETDMLKIVNGLLAQYKRHADHYVISKSLHATIQVAVAVEPRVTAVDAIFDALVKEMFAQIVYDLEHLSPPPSSPPAKSSITTTTTNKKNQKELLRSFSELSEAFCCCGCCC